MKVADGEGPQDGGVAVQADIEVEGVVVVPTRRRMRALEDVLEPARDVQGGEVVRRMLIVRHLARDVLVSAIANVGGEESSNGLIHLRGRFAQADLHSTTRVAARAHVNPAAARHVPSHAASAAVAFGRHRGQRDAHRLQNPPAAFFPAPIQDVGLGKLIAKCLEHVSQGLVVLACVTQGTVQITDGKCPQGRAICLAGTDVEVEGVDVVPSRRGMLALKDELPPARDIERGEIVRRVLVEGHLTGHKRVRSSIATGLQESGHCPVHGVGIHLQIHLQRAATIAARAGVRSVAVLLRDIGFKAASALTRRPWLHCQS
mmetsp:Transcript_44966/g.103983  ORF Transcript_44966/g.103983 Transcript_44966/m.103983 type:complete len:317 (+) Transcript_44966:248-1198(+)